MRIIYLLLIAFFIGCNFSKTSEPGDENSISDSLTGKTSDTLEFDSTGIAQFSPDFVDSTEFLIPDTTELERTILGQGLVDIKMVESTIETDIKYSSLDNFMEEDVYGDFDKCYLQPVVAEMLKVAQQKLKERDSLLSLLVFDCVRPRSVQLIMWDIVKGTDQQKYVAPPNGGGSMHNYGAAIDLGLVHLDTGLVDMGTPYDFFGNLAQPRYETQFLQSGELTQQQAQNRWILREVMKEAGFHIILSEWWHFNAFQRPETREKFKIVE